MFYIITTDGNFRNLRIVENGKVQAGIKSIRLIADSNEELARLVIEREFYVKEHSGGLTNFDPKYKIVSDGLVENTTLFINSKPISSLEKIDFLVDEKGVKINVTSGGEEKVLVEFKEEEK